MSNQRGGTLKNLIVLSMFFYAYSDQPPITTVVYSPAQCFIESCTAALIMSVGTQEFFGNCTGTAGVAITSFFVMYHFLKKQTASSMLDRIEHALTTVERKLNLVQQSYGKPRNSARAFLLATWCRYLQGIVTRE